MKYSDILKSLEKYKLAYGERYGILKIGIFGSVAKGTMDAQSDLDIVVNLQEQDLFSLIGIKQELEEELNIQVDLVSYRPQMNPFLKKRIEQEAVYV